jgi:hypothetical protein
VCCYEKSSTTLIEEELLNTSQSYEIVLTSVSFLRSSEETNLDNVLSLSRKIEDEGRWTTPITVEKHTGIVMDGNHRLHVARLIGIQHIPCVLLEYNDPRVDVFHWSHDTPFDTRAIFASSAENRLLPYKSTRHIFSPAIPSTNVPLRSLFQKQDICGESQTI